MIPIFLIVTISCFGGLRGRYNVDDQIKGSSAVVSPGDNLQGAYDQLKSPGNDGKMGPLSPTNRRSLLLSPGTYTMAETVLLDTDYVDVLELVEGTVTLAKSGNGMGFVILPDIDAILITADDRSFVGRYSRNSIASTEQISLSINEIKDKPMPLAGIITSMEEDSTEFGGGPVRMGFASNGLSTDRLFGHTPGDDKITTSPDGSTWTLNTDQAEASTTLETMWATDNLGNCVMCGRTSPNIEVWYGTWVDSGTLADRLTVARSQLDGGDMSFESGTLVNQWNFLQTSAGTSLLTEYGTNGRYIYRSTDKGASFTQIFDPGVGVITHWHAIGQLAATGRIVAFAGDNVKSNMYYSDDDGLTWTAFYTAGEAIIQPVALLDIGHSTKMLCGADTQEGLFLLDAYSGEVTPLFKDQDRVVNRGYFFSLMQNDGLIYAGSYDSTTNAAGSTPAVYVTSDLVNWTPIYRVQKATSFGLRNMVWFNDELHGSIISNGAPTNNHLTLAVSDAVSSKYGVTCEQTMTNQLTIPGNSSYEDGDFLDYVSSQSADIAQVTANTAGIPSIPNGTYGVRCSRNDNQTIFATRTAASAYGVAVSAADIVSGSIMVGLPITAKPTIITVKFCKDDGDPATNTALDASLVTNAILRPGEWKTLYIKPTLVDAADGDILGIMIGASIDVGTDTDILIDNVQISADGDQSSSWQIGGTARATAKYDLNWNTPEKATHIFTFTPFAQSSWYDALGGDWYIRSWRITAATHAELYYDADDQKFKLAIVIDGGDDDLLASAAAVWFKKGQAIVFAIQFGDDGDTNAHMSVGHGRTIDTVDGAAEDYSSTYGLADILVRWGDEDAANGLNGTLYDLDMTGVMTASDIVSYIDSLISG
jgi:hypothetical protein